MTIPEKPEPSVLDYLKGRLFPGRNPEVMIPDSNNVTVVTENFEESAATSGRKRKKLGFFWQLVFILVVILVGQQLIEPPSPSPIFALIFFGCAVLLIILHWFQNRYEVDLYPYEESEPTGFIIHSSFLYASIGTGILATIMFTGNRFNSFNLLVWTVSILFFVAAFLKPVTWTRATEIVSDFLNPIIHKGLNLRIKPWHLLFGFVFLITLFFRFYRLDDVPGEMISDHAEKLLDVYDLLNGMVVTYFTRNTGREAFQMYLSAAIARVFDTGIAFITLKTGTVILGVFTAVFMYYLGKELGNRHVGMLAFLLSGIGYWPNVISRIGLRFTLYPAFTAPALYFFFKGIRRKNIFDFILSGIFVGIGLHGYSSYRVVPVLLILGIIIYLMHHWNKPNFRFAITGLVVTGIAALILFIPLLRYIMDQPDMFFFRAMTRVGTIEQPLPGPAWKIFLSNLWWAVIMPFWNNGTIWVHSIPYRPALDILTAAAYLAGLVFSILRYIRHRDWRIPFLLLSIPFLMLPSIISLAFPEENPCLNRPAGALVPIFIIATQGLDILIHNLFKQAKESGGRAKVVVLTGILLSLTIWQNYDLVFNIYAQKYKESAWNTSELGEVARNFIAVYGDPDSVYVVGFPHWVDTRLVAIVSGHPEKDYAIWPDQFSDTLSNQRAKLFLIKPDDTASLDQLRKMYPEYYETVYTSEIDSHSFVMFMVPPGINSIEEAENPVP